MLAAAAESGQDSGITGMLQDEQGRPLGAARVLACMSTVCFTDITEADGRFMFKIDPPAAVAIKTSPDPDATPRRGAALRPVRLDAARLIDVGAVHVPALPVGVALSETGGSEAQTVRPGDGLVITLQRTTLKAPPGEVVVDLAARRLPTRLIPVYPTLAGERVLAVYALHPFGAASSTPIAVEAPVDAADGTTVSFRTVSEIDGVLSDPVPGRVVAGIASTAAGRGIRHLTYLVISRRRAQ